MQGLEVVAESIRNVGPDVLANIGEMMIGENRVIVIIGEGDSRAHVLVILGEGAEARGLHAGRMAKEIASTLGGGGGGSAKIGRGAGSSGKSGDALERALGLIEGA